MASLAAARLYDMKWFEQVTRNAFTYNVGDSLAAGIGVLAIPEGHIWRTGFQKSEFEGIVFDVYLSPLRCDMLRESSCKGSRIRCDHICPDVNWFPSRISWNGFQIVQNVELNPLRALSFLFPVILEKISDGEKTPNGWILKIGVAGGVYPRVVRKLQMSLIGKENLLNGAICSASKVPSGSYHQMTPGISWTTLCRSLRKRQSKLIVLKLGGTAKTSCDVDRRFRIEKELPCAVQQA
ncbi:hypothetical protein POM88_031896 [Heracleum sosnowskyi]|uniref:Uncharacterized protein n=1 Tax=Heracleum sosnowskyi TaxID=360622 RepID=A0AAD8I0C5_9APIA|nr:hypothetical protein POM88_031896 [Heracleum sosnowskyi]